MSTWLIYLGATYASASLLLFIFPRLLHTKKNYNADILNDVVEGRKFLRISHRGGPRLTTQNTVQAFRKVIHHSDMLQMDVCETADGVLVVHHDKSLKRTCGVQGNVGDYKYSELPKFQQQIKLDFAQNQTVASNNQKIPTLQQVYQLFPGVLMDIQLKTPTQSAMKEFARLTYEYDRQDYTICGIRSKENDRFRQDNPKILGFMNDRAVMKLGLAYFLGFAPFMKLEEDSLQIPVYSKEMERWALEKNPPETHFKIKIFLKFIKFINFACKPLIWHLKQRGIMTLLWVCNDQQSYDRALWMGGQGIMTDQPFQLHDYLTRKGLA